MAANPQKPPFPELCSQNWPVAKPDDRTLLEGIAAGSEEAMMVLYDRYSGLVFAVACHVVLDPRTAEDISQEVFLQLWQKVHCFDPARGSLGAWLTVVTRHRAIDVVRSRKPDVNIDDVVIPIDSKQISDLFRKEIWARMGEALSRMPEPQMQVLEMAYFQGMTQEEISAKTGAPLGTVKSRTRLALNWIRKKLIDKGL